MAEKKETAWELQQREVRAMERIADALEALVRLTEEGR